MDCRLNENQRPWSRKPVIFMLTSPKHPVDTFLMAIKLLEKNTDLRKVEKIYICANAVDTARHAIIKNFLKRNPNAKAIHCEPLGHLPCVPFAQNLINERHCEGPIIKMDDDMFVTPGWLDSLMDAYEATRNDTSLGIISPLVPINFIGLQSLFEFLAHEYAHDFSNLFMWGQAHLGSSNDVHEFVWEKVLHDDMIGKFGAWLQDNDPWWPFHGASGYVSINCILYDWRLVERIHPLPYVETFYIDPYPQTGNHHKLFDETIMNRCIEDGELTGLVVRDSIVHHYAFNRVETWLRERHPVETVSEYLFSLESKQDIVSRPSMTRRPSPKSTQPIQHLTNIHPPRLTVSP